MKFIFKGVISFFVRDIIGSHVGMSGKDRKRAELGA